MKNSETLHPLEGLWLVHRLSTRVGDVALKSFHSVMELQDRCSQQAVFNATGKTLGTVDYDYFERRRRVEAWLKSGAEAQGLSLDGVDHPLYFILQDKPQLTPEGEDSTYFNIPASVLPAERLTVTIMDSFFNYTSLHGLLEDEAYRVANPRVFTAFGFHEEGSPVLDNQGDFYTECQAWLRFEDTPALQEVATLVTGSKIITLPVS